jgi:hypothetical protein
MRRLACGQKVAEAVDEQGPLGSKPLLFLWAHIFVLTTQIPRIKWGHWQPWCVLESRGDTRARGTPVSFPKAIKSKPKSTCFSKNKWMDKQNVGYLYKRILLSHKKEWNTNWCYKINDPQKIVCLVKDVSHKRPHGAWFHLWEIYRIGKLRETEISGAGAGGTGGGGVIARGYSVSF